jgi:deoxyribodipyrimidine photolyase-related protein
MTVGVWIIGDQLWRQSAAIASVPLHTPVIMIESLDHVQARPYHRQKLVLIWSAMRHFAAELVEAGHAVEYIEADSFAQPLQRWIKTHKITELRLTAPTDKPFAEIISTLSLDCNIKILENNHFLWTEAEFKTWAKDRKRLLMEDFYRQCRRRFNILMQPNGKPVGDQWNFDQDNRKPPKKNDPSFNPPIPLDFKPDVITQQVIRKVENLKTPIYGKLDTFTWAVTRSQALQVLDNFITQRLQTFGPYQDAMVTGQDTMWHALLSPYINLGLLHPLEVVQAVADRQDDRNLSSVEGFIRQVIGWREYMRGVYSIAPDDYGDRNWFDHQEALPEFFWDSSQAKMNCLKQCLDQTERTGYAHHIQRLMILSNFALVAGIEPRAIENWFHSAYIDAYDWVMKTNVLGMGQYADGGMLASKPYASSANYVNKMSDYCKGCRYDHKARMGEKACPFNYFYWDFLDRHREKLTTQGRMSFILKNLDKMTEAELTEIRQLADRWHQEN